MRGRPKNSNNDALFERLNDLKYERSLSDADLAVLLKVHPSTVSRSMATRKFSADLEMRSQRLLAGSSQRVEALHLLQQFAIKLPAIQRALDLVLDRAKLQD
jgi:hypothetical protein